MKVINAPGIGPVVHPGTDAEADEAQRILNARARFVEDYCRARGWPTDPKELSISQLLEATSQEAWLKP